MNEQSVTRHVSGDSDKLPPTGAIFHEPWLVPLTLIGGWLAVYAGWVFELLPTFEEAPRVGLGWQFHVIDVVLGIVFFIAVSGSISPVTLAKRWGTRLLAFCWILSCFLIASGVIRGAYHDWEPLFQRVIPWGTLIVSVALTVAILNHAVLPVFLLPKGKHRSDHQSAGPAVRWTGIAILLICWILFQNEDIFSEFNIPFHALLWLELGFKLGIGFYCLTFMSGWLRVRWRAMLALLIALAVIPWIPAMQFQHHAMVIGHSLMPQSPDGYFVAQVAILLGLGVCVLVVGWNDCLPKLSDAPKTSPSDVSSLRAETEPKATRTTKPWRWVTLLMALFSLAIAHQLPFQLDVPSAVFTRDWKMARLLAFVRGTNGSLQYPADSNHGRVTNKVTFDMNQAWFQLDEPDLLKLARRGIDPKSFFAPYSLYAGNFHTLEGLKVAVKFASFTLHGNEITSDQLSELEDVGSLGIITFKEVHIDQNWLRQLPASRLIFVDCQIEQDALEALPSRCEQVELIGLIDDLRYQQIMREPRELFLHFHDFSQIQLSEEALLQCLVNQPLVVGDTDHQWSWPDLEAWLLQRNFSEPFSNALRRNARWAEGTLRINAMPISEQALKMSSFELTTPYWPAARVIQSLEFLKSLDPESVQQISSDMPGSNMLQVVSRFKKLKRLAMWPPNPGNPDFPKMLASLPELQELRLLSKFSGDYSNQLQEQLKKQFSAETQAVREDCEVWLILKPELMSWEVPSESLHDGVNAIRISRDFR